MLRTKRHQDPEKIARLRQLPLFAACSSAELATLARLTDEVRVAAGTILTHEGSPGNEFLMIFRGTATVRRDGKPIASLGPGDFFGEMALLERAPRSATVVAGTDMQLFVLEPREFEAALNDSWALEKEILRTLSRRLRAAESG